MQLNKSLALPILGMAVLIIFNLWSYLHEAIFLDRLLICTLILGLIFISKVLKSSHQPMRSYEGNEKHNRQPGPDYRIQKRTIESESIEAYNAKNLQKKEEVA
ncbi:hypothetical protein [Pareuzebyella sediminis]|uniref:hypothetical protein n=1 Tax=Pareuzebyella sediminis TaxID=2607998 RepID=UPI0011EE081E|nr:hypothetical protein [Pareuzebyella sediminis]